MKKILFIVLSYITKFFKIKILITRQANERLLAVKSSQGFWYIGDLFNHGDIAYGIFQNGEVEYLESKLFKFLIDIVKERSGPDKKLCVYDIGAHTGYYSLLSAAHEKRIQIYGFEPVKSFYSIAKANVDLNKLNDLITLYPIGLSNESKKTPIVIAGSGSHFTKETTEGQQTEEVEVFRLDDFKTQYNLQKADIMKIDVESHELFMLNGMKQILIKERPILFMEIIKVHQSVENRLFSETFDFMSNANYQCYIYSFETDKVIFNKFNPVTRDRDSIENLAMYLFIPTEQIDTFANRATFL